MVQVTGAEVNRSPEIELTAYRIIQEALHNITKHTKATKATIEVTFSHDAVKVEIIDCGGGFKLPDMLSNYARNGKLGLISMNERANLVGGTFKISSNQGIGTTVSIEIPREVKVSP
jgi:signal transduction histidine kinase